MATRPMKQQPERSPETGTTQGGFSFDDVKKLVQLVEKSDVTHLSWKRGDERVVISRGAARGRAGAGDPRGAHRRAGAAPTLAAGLLAGGAGASKARAQGRQAGRRGEVALRRHLLPRALARLRRRSSRWARR